MNVPIIRRLVREVRIEDVDVGHEKHDEYVKQHHRIQILKLRYEGSRLQKIEHMMSLAMQQERVLIVQTGINNIW